MHHPKCIRMALALVLKPGSFVIAALFALLSEGRRVQGGAHPSLSSTCPGHTCSPQYPSHPGFLCLVRDPRHAKLHLTLWNCQTQNWSVCVYVCLTLITMMIYQYNV